VLGKLGVAPLDMPPDPLFRSTAFARWDKPPVPVEVMAGFHVAIAGQWHPVKPRSRERIDLEGIGLFVPDRRELLALFRSFGRPKDGPRIRALEAAEATALLAAAESLAGARVDLVAIDMPLARTPIVARRTSDNAITRAFGGRYCGTHSPSAVRPGAISDALRAGFEDAGYPLQTHDARGGGLIEVYPHPALVVLAQAPRRLPYKASKTRTYWPDQSLAARRALLAAKWARIVALLAMRMDGVAEALPALPSTASGIARKAQEDMMDAVVCAWVGITALEGEADAYGDFDSAIWVPRDGGTAGLLAG